MTEKRNLPIARPSTGDDEWQALKGPVMSGWLTQGPKVAAFEQAFAERHQVKAAIATTSCTTALHLIFAAMKIGPGDEVIVPSFTWVATANAVVQTGAVPVLADVDTSTYSLLPSEVAARVTGRTRAVIAVHLFGLCADVGAIAEAAGGVPVIEDAACAAGAALRGMPAGGLGLAGAFSFHPRKLITTGEGGMVTTNDQALAEAITMLRNHGASVSEEQRHHGPRPHLLPEFEVAGFNYRMTDLQGAVGLVQLGKLDRFIKERRQLVAIYREALEGLSWLTLPAIPNDWDMSWQALVCMVDEEAAPMPRNRIMDALLEKGIATRPGTHAVHLLSHYRKRLGFAAEALPGALACDRRSMALPLFNGMTDDDIRYVADALRALG